MKFKVFFLFCLYSLSNFAYASENIDKSVSSSASVCEYEWSVSAKGIHVGVSKDKVINDKDQFVIKSDFKPSGFARAFGLKNIQRNVFFLQGKLVKRQEMQNNQGQTLIEWIRGEDGTFIRTSKEERRVEPVDNSTIIDSTSFLYIYSSKMIDLTNRIKEVTVLTKNKLYSADISLKKDDVETLIFKSKNNYGEVVFKDNHPNTFKLDDDKGTVVGKVVSIKCQ